MMIIGDLSSYKSEMMAKYFGKNSEEIIMGLTVKGYVKGAKKIEILRKQVKLDWLDTTQNKQNPELFESLVKEQRGVLCIYNPFKQSSFEYVKSELK